MIFAASLGLGTIVLSLLVYVGWRVVKDRQDQDALGAFYQRLGSRNAAADEPDYWSPGLGSTGSGEEG